MLHSTAAATAAAPPPQAAAAQAAVEDLSTFLATNVGITNHDIINDIIYGFRDHNIVNVSALRNLHRTTGIGPLLHKDSLSERIASALEDDSMVQRHSMRGSHQASTTADGVVELEVLLHIHPSDDGCVPGSINRTAREPPVDCSPTLLTDTLVFQYISKTKVAPRHPILVPAAFDVVGHCNSTHRVRYALARNGGPPDRWRRAINVHLTIFRPFMSFHVVSPTPEPKPPAMMADGRCIRSKPVCANSRSGALCLMSTTRGSISSTRTTRPVRSSGPELSSCAPELSSAHMLSMSRVRVPRAPQTRTPTCAVGQRALWV